MLPIFFCFIVFCLWLRYELKKSSSLAEKNKSHLFDDESRANSTRKKSINSLNYITISEKSILFIEINKENTRKDVFLRESMSLEMENTDIASTIINISKVQTKFRHLANEKILNLNGKTNTQLKLEYGPGNLSTLINYDDNFSELVRLLHKYAKLLLDLNYISESIEVLEYSVSIGSDMITTYKLLYELYKVSNRKEKIDFLIQSANMLNSITKKPILECLNSSIL